MKREALVKPLLLLLTVFEVSDPAFLLLLLVVEFVFEKSRKKVEFY